MYIWICTTIKWPHISFESITGNISNAWRRRCCWLLGLTLLLLFIICLIISAYIYSFIHSTGCCFSTATEISHQNTCVEKYGMHIVRMYVCVFLCSWCVRRLFRLKGKCVSPSPALSTSLALSSPMPTLSKHSEIFLCLWCFELL